MSEVLTALLIVVVTSATLLLLAIGAGWFVLTGNKERTVFGGLVFTRSYRVRIHRWYPLVRVKLLNWVYAPIFRAELGSLIRSEVLSRDLDQQARFAVEQALAIVECRDPLSIDSLINAHRLREATTTKYERDPDA